MDTQTVDHLKRFADLFDLRTKQIAGDRTVRPLRLINADSVSKGGKLHSPLAVMIDLTSDCNQNCVFCYRSGPHTLMPDGKPKFLPLGNLERICRELKEANVSSLTLTGGEPTRHPHFIEAVRMAKQFGFFLTVVTNGSHITENNIGRLAQLLDPVCDKIELSFNAATGPVFRDITGIDGFSRFIRTLECFREYRIPFLTMTLILKRNQDQIDRILELASSHGAQECAVEPPFPKKNMPKETYASIDMVLDIHETLCRREYRRPKIQLNFLHLAMNLPGGLETLKSLLGRDGSGAASCHGGTASCALDIDGTMHMCQFLIDLNTCATGNIYEESFLSLWQRLQQKKARLVTGNGATRALDGCPGFALEKGGSL